MERVGAEVGLRLGTKKKGIFVNTLPQSYLQNVECEMEIFYGKGRRDQILLKIQGFSRMAMKRKWQTVQFLVHWVRNQIISSG